MPLNKNRSLYLKKIEIIKDAEATKTFMNINVAIRQECNFFLTLFNTCFDEALSI